MGTLLNFRRTLVVMIFTLAAYVNAQPAGYDFGKQLLINAAQVSGSSNLTNFVMLVSFTDADLRTVANGGHVSSSNGFDIVFTLGDCNTLLDHQIEKYVPTTGEFIAWVKIPTVFAASNTNIHMYYGNTAVSADPSTSNVWDANHAAVYHMNQSPAGTSPQLTDYTSNTNNGVANGSMVAGDLVPGIIGDAIDFDGSNDYFDCGSDASTDPVLDITVTAWVFSRAASGHVINRGGGWDDPGYSMFLLSNNVRIELQNTTEKDIVDNGYTLNTWQYIALTYDNSTGTIRCFINGVQQGTTGNHTGPMSTPVENLNIGRKEQNAFYINAIIDESRVIHSFRNGDWIATEYNNQNAPNTFYTKSIEYSANNLCWTLPVELLEFTAEPLGSNAAVINWTTASEINNDYFIVQKSTDFNEWTDIAEVNGAGNSSQLINYEYIDREIAAPIVYYRLLQKDFDGKYSLSEVASVQFKNYLENILFPNPANHMVSVKTENKESVKLFNLAGQLLLQVYPSESSLTQIDISNLASGTYLVQTGNRTEKLVKF